MRKLQKWTLAIGVVFIYLMSMSGIAAAGELPSATADGKFGTKCYWTRKKEGDLCQVSFYAILAAPEKYDGRHIGLTGYLIEISHQLVLFANRQSYESGVEGEGVTLFGANLSPGQEAKVGHGLWPVTVIGVFDAKFSADPRPRLGAMREIFNVVQMPRGDPRIILGK